MKFTSESDFKSPWFKQILPSNRSSKKLSYMARSQYHDKYHINLPVSRKIRVIEHVKTYDSDLIASVTGDKIH